MHSIKGRNVNHVFRDAIWWLRVSGQREDSRNGPVLVAPGPVISEYTHPHERVLFEPRRDANPVFHLMESLWMLAGDSKLEWLVQFNARMARYGENGIQWGAYGRRWRGYFGHNQIKAVIKELTDNPNSRRAVMGMWDPALDLIHSGSDIPCNTHIYFDLRNGALNMTVCCRSNDVIWGAYGANVVHFSVLQEVMAHELRVLIGDYRQFSNNFHMYTDLDMAKSFLQLPPEESDDRYMRGEAFAQPILVGGESYDMLYEDCRTLVDGGSSMKVAFMNDVARPLRDSYLARKACHPYTVPSGQIDWFVAYGEWIQRRESKNVSQ